MGDDAMLTTIDNPYDPFTQFDEWYAYDEMKGYCTCGLIARITKTSDGFDIATQEKDIDDAIDDILELIPDGFYKRVYPKQGA